MDRDEIVRVLRAFEAEGLEYVLIGATAMGFHRVVRATEDVDLFIRATSDNVERLRSAFRRAYGDDPHLEEISAADLLGNYPALRYYPPTADLYFDVMTRLGEAARFDTVEREIKEVDGIRVSVATPAALYRLKKGTVRSKDRQDAAAARTVPPHGGGLTCLCKSSDQSRRCTERQSSRAAATISIGSCGSALATGKSRRGCIRAESSSSEPLRMRSTRARHRVLPVGEARAKR